MQDVHVDARPLFRHDTSGRAGLKQGSGLVIRFWSGLGTLRTTAGGVALPDT